MRNTTLAGEGVAVSAGGASAGGSPPPQNANTNTPKKQQNKTPQNQTKTKPTQVVDVFRKQDAVYARFAVCMLVAARYQVDAADECVLCVWCACGAREGGGDDDGAQTSPTQLNAQHPKHKTKNKKTKKRRASAC